MSRHAGHERDGPDHRHAAGSAASPDPLGAPDPLEAELGPAEDRVVIAEWSRRIPPIRARIPEVRVGKRWYSTAWLIPISIAGLISEAGLPPITLHGLRHGAATMGLAAGLDMKVVSAMLRHSSVTITNDLYTSVLPDVARDAAEKTAAMVPRRVTVSRTSGTIRSPRIRSVPSGRE